MERPEVRVAAHVSRTFHLDPVVVLDEVDTFRRAVRLASHNIVVRDENEAAEKARQSKG